MCLLLLFWYTCNNVHEGGCLHPAVGKALERLSSENLGSVALVVFEEASKPFTTPHRACTLRVLTNHRKEEHVTLPLMIPLVMIMCHILRQRMAERRFPKQDQPCKTLLLDRPHPALRVGVQIRRSRRQRDPRDPGRIDDLLKGRTVFPIPLMDQILSG